MMKKLFAFVIAATMTLCMAALATAQDAGPQGGRLQGKQRGGPGGMRIMMKIQKEALDELKLTNVQKKAIVELDKKTADEMKDLMQKAKDGGKPDRDAMKKVCEEHMQGMKDILGQEKFRQFRELVMKKMKEYREKNGDKGGPADRQGRKGGGGGGD